MVRSSPRASIGFSMFEASIDPSGRARPDDRVQLVNEEDDLPGGVGDFLQDRFQALFELTPEFRAGDQRA
jgi:hypothetical protein